MPSSARKGKIRKRLDRGNSSCPKGCWSGKTQLRDGSWRLASKSLGHVDLSGINFTSPTCGSGKTTLLKIVAGDLAPTTGTVSRSGGLAAMRQFIGSIRDTSTVRDLLFSLAPPRLQVAPSNCNGVTWSR
jgi:translation initiation factor RLI1